MHSPMSGWNKRKSFETGAISLFLAIPLGLVAVTGVVYLLFANAYLKGLAEQHLGQSLGAEVNIESVDHSLFPFGIEVNRLQATDNANPVRNKFESAQILADVEFMPLLSGKLIMENLIISDLAFGTARQSEGEVYRVPDANSGFLFPSLEELPSVDEILENTPLKSAAAAENAKMVYDKYQQPLTEKYNTLPDEQKINAYKERVKQIQETDYKNPIELANALESLKQLKADISSDRKNISEFVNLAKTAQSYVGDAVEQLKTAPQEDYDLLKNLVAGDEAAISQVSQHLFGDKANLYVKALMTMAEMALNAEAGPEEVKVDDSGLPNLWIKNAQISVKLMEQTLESNWTNITENHQLAGSPTTFLVNSLASEQWNQIKIEGDFLLENGMVSGSNRWDLKGIALQAIDLVPADAKQKLMAILNSGLLDSTGELSLSNNQLIGNSVFDLSNLSLSAEGTNDLTKAIAGILEEQNNINFAGNFAGTVTDPKINVTSNLDNQLVSSLVSGAQNNPKLSELRQKLNEQVNEQLGTSGDQLDNINSLLSAANGDMTALSDLLSAELEDPKAKGLKKLKDLF